MKHLHLISRKTAINIGLLFYCTGKSCCRNHFSERFVSNRQCRDCWLEDTRKWYLDNKDSVLASQKIYSNKNKEKRSLQRRARYTIQKEYELKKNKEWRQNNKAAICAYSVKYQKSKINRTPSWLTKDNLKSIETEYELAAWCSKVMGIKYHVDHIVPLQGKQVSGLHVPWNLQVIPAVDNLIKSNQFKV